MATIAFQSSPGPKAGRSSAEAARVALLVKVSILARPEGRALPGRSVGSIAACW